MIKNQEDWTGAIEWAVSPLKRQISRLQRENRTMKKRLEKLEKEPKVTYYSTSDRHL